MRLLLCVFLLVSLSLASEDCKEYHTVGKVPESKFICVENVLYKNSEVYQVSSCYCVDGEMFFKSSDSEQKQASSKGL